MELVGPAVLLSGRDESLDAGELIVIKEVRYPNETERILVGTGLCADQAYLTGVPMM